MIYYVGDLFVCLKCDKGIYFFKKIQQNIAMFYKQNTLLGLKKKIKFYPFLLLSRLIVSFNDNYRRKFPSLCCMLMKKNEKGEEEEE